MEKKAIPEWEIFARMFLKHPRDISSLFPTRRAVAERIAAKICEQRSQVIVEYGPATGSLSREILRSGKLAPGSSLILIEKMKEFADYLKETVKDPRVSVVNGSALDVLEILRRCGVENADYVFSGIPLSLMPEDVSDAIVRNTSLALQENGRFIQYACRRGIATILRRHFHAVGCSMETFNVPPLAVFDARKN